MAIRKNMDGGNAAKCNVIEKCAVIGERLNGYKLELRVVSWYGGPEKYDIRPWKVDDDGAEKCGEGIQLSGEELESLYHIIGGMMQN